jgi:hypothetical protein
LKFFLPTASSIRHEANAGAVLAQAAGGFSQSYPQKVCMAGAMLQNVTLRTSNWPSKGAEGVRHNCRCWRKNS